MKLPELIEQVKKEIPGIGNITFEKDIEIDPIMYVYYMPLRINFKVPYCEAKSVLTASILRILVKEIELRMSYHQASMFSLEEFKFSLEKL